MGVLEVWCIKIIQSGAAYLYRTGTRVYLFSKNNRCGLLQKSSHSFAGPCGESLSERKLKVWINWCITKGLYVTRDEGQSWHATREFYWKVNFIREFTKSYEAWSMLEPWTFFIAWKPQDFPETMHIRGEIRNFPFYIRDAWTDFSKIRRRPAISYRSPLSTN